MSKIDYKKQFKDIYSASAKQCSIIRVPKMSFLMIDGKGDPNHSDAFQEAINALFRVSYTIKFMIKKSKEFDYGVMPLEGLWWCDTMDDFSVENKINWQWTLMIMQPDVVKQAVYEEAAEKVLQQTGLMSVNQLRFESYEEGLVTQILHIGPFTEEGPTVETLHNFIGSNGYAMSKKHHEIYLSDTRRSNPKNWKTIIRQPVLETV